MAFLYMCLHVSNPQTRALVGVFSLALVALIIWCIDTSWSNGATFSVMLMERISRFWRSITSRRQPEDGDEDAKAREQSEELAIVAGDPELFTNKMPEASRKWSWGGKVLVRSATGDATEDLNGSSSTEGV